ncbi:MAG: Oligo-1,6-glucosidase [Candidatus Carbobacillus altaicus]|uniref:oligo-1,6-glucosidase n=1 Tax=Candidatus Carbonibacillus altaicus TaxID=2163959 RepID=A0A2R6XY22_9BACL|nr:MAG: Oligo-1,6-glucosidase [Candidatus Carbobacillus altaicus]
MTIVDKRTWWKEAVVYQIYPRSFYDTNGDGIGDLNGITAKLDYLQELGVDVLWLSPIFRSPNADNGYDISDYEDIMAEFGTLSDFDRLLKEAKARGLKLLLDLVVNHTSDEHPWFIASRKNDPRYRDFYIWREGKEGAPPTNWFAAFGGSAWKYVPERRAYYLHLFTEKQPDLNWEEKNVRDAVYAMMRFWLDKGVDGFRMDVINLIGKPDVFEDAPVPPGETYGNGFAFIANHPKSYWYLREMYDEVLSHYDVMTVGETPAVTPDVALNYVADGKPLNMVFQFEHMDVDSGKNKWDVRPVDWVRFKTIMSRWEEGLADRGWNSLYLNNHDQPRSVSRYVTRSADSALRRRGAKMLATMLHLMQGTPFIYQGEEIGMTNVAFPRIEDYRDVETLNFYAEGRKRGVAHEALMPSIYAKSRDNARTPMQWSHERHAGFTQGEPWIKVGSNYTEINVESSLSDPDSIFHYYRALIRLRKRLPVIVYGTYTVYDLDHPSLYIYERKLNGDALLVLLNLTETVQHYTVPSTFYGHQAELILNNIEPLAAFWPYINGEVAPDLTLHRLTDLTFAPYEARVYHLVSA